MSVEDRTLSYATPARSRRKVAWIVLGTVAAGMMLIVMLMGFLWFARLVQHREVALSAAKVVVSPSGASK